MSEVTVKLQKKLDMIRLEPVIMAAIFLGALGFYALNWKYSLSGGFFGLIGGVSTVGAERVLNGDIPHRDFWTMYAPGHFYLLALLYVIFGTHLMVEVVAASVLCAATAVLCYWLGTNLTGRRFASVVPAVIYMAATYSTGYVRRISSYTTVAFLIFIILNLVVLYWKSGRNRYLVFAGSVTGLAVLFKHDVAGYTTIAVVAGLAVYQLSSSGGISKAIKPILSNLVIFGATMAVVVLPFLLYFAIVAGPEMLQNMIVFPLTDFRFARPEGYPSLIPGNFIAESTLQTIRGIANYFQFTIVFILFILGGLATALAVKWRRTLYIAAGISFSVGFLFHYFAAHIQINTHIITMSVYAALVGLILYDMLEGKILARRPLLHKGLLIVFCAGWLLAFAAKPAYTFWLNRGTATVELALPKVSGFYVSPEAAQTYTDLTNFLDSHVAPDQEIFVGLHRHDVIVIGDVMVYFILDRPIATRYHELHPAITDSQPAQQEIIADLQQKNVDYVITKVIFPDERLEQVKRNFQANLPQVGATDLDTFLKDNYEEIQFYGPYTVWKRTEASE